MPTYDYVCDACNERMEIFQKMSDPKLDTCPKCGKKKLRRLLGAGSGIVFKGTGYYCTDFKGNNSKKS